MTRASETSILATPEYWRFIEELKARVTSARIPAARAMNRDGILLYWDIGRGIVEKQRVLGWGGSVVEMIAADLRRAFPRTKGFSAQNVWRMKQFYLTHTAEDFLSQLVREIGASGGARPDASKLSQAVRELVVQVPWGHYANVLPRLSDPAARLWYLRATAQFGWTRNVLLNHRHHPLRGKRRRRSRIRPARQNQPHWRRRVSTSVETAAGFEGKTSDCQTACRRCAVGYSRRDRPVTKYFYRYQPPTPAKDLLAKFWNLERETEKLLEGLVSIRG